MATTPVSPQPAQLEERAVEIAVVAADQLAARRIGSVLGASGLPPFDLMNSVEELLARTEAREPQIVVLACDPSTRGGLGSLRTLADGLSEASVVLVSTGSEGTSVRQALAAGARGIVYDSELETTLAPTAFSVLVGHVSLPRSLQRCLFKPAFSHREKQVLSMAARGLGNRQIADRLFLAESTVKSHLATAFQKLGVRSRTEAAALLLDPDEGLGTSVLSVELEEASPLVASAEGWR
jgi:DNA-binding NarL/FixJ family response regulator